jgi:hypothetical protein
LISLTSAPVIPRAAVRGTAIGVLFMAFFGTLWAGIGIGGLQGAGMPWTLIVFVASAFLLVCGIALLRSAKRLPAGMTPEDARRGKRIWKWFGIVFGLEGAMIGAASGICGATDHFELFFPIMAIIVGAHFFPLAPLFQVRLYYGTGALLCLLGAATLLFVPEEASYDGHQIVVWWTVVGFGSALILWGTGLFVWLNGIRWLRKTGPLSK